MDGERRAMGEERRVIVEERRVGSKAKWGDGEWGVGEVCWRGEVRGKERGGVSWESACASWSRSWSSQFEFGVGMGVEVVVGIAVGVE
jgi:hypothetical protein